VKKVLFFISAFLFLLLSVFSNLTNWEALSVSMMLYFLGEFLQDLGKKINILDLIILMAIFTWLVMPVIFYHFYTKQNHLAKIWVKYMAVESDEYFSFVIPGTIMLILGLRIPLGNLTMKATPWLYMRNVKSFLADKSKLGLILVAIGACSGFLNRLVPESVAQIFYFLAHLTFVGVFYVIYSPNKQKKLIILLVIALMFGQAIITGMFGEMVFIIILSGILLMLGTKLTFGSKFLFFLLGLVFILLIQSVKADYRRSSWEKGVGADPAYFAELIGDRISNPGSILDEKSVFVSAFRMNQGWLVSMTMYFVPEKFPYANGETIWQSVAASFVPRFMWPDKPESGGKANIKRFWGMNLNGYSINIGPIGEAYGNFGRWGGIVYMFFYGLFFNFIMFRILTIAEKKPTLILWLPFLFIYAVNVETDLLTTMNALIKGVFFIWVMYAFFRRFLQIEL